MFLKSMLFLTIYLVLLVNTVSSEFSMAQSVANFTVSIFQDTNTANSNFIVSPISAQIVLGLTYAGASGPTAQAMNAGLDLIGQTQQEVIDDFNALITSLNHVDNSTTLDIANKIYINRTFTLSPSFQNAASKFHSGVQTINFADNVNAANAINAWASKETGGNIKNVVDASNFNSNTAMVLLNAIYFKGVWHTKFDPSKSKPRTFHPSSTTVQQQIPFMNVQSNFNYGYSRTLQANTLQLMYTDPSLSMLFILPNDADALQQAISQLSGNEINSILSNMYSKQVIVSIPKFTIKSSINLNDALKQMGMDIIFGSQANFSGMVTHLSPCYFLYVNAVSQNAWIEVNEEGATAAAVTVVSIRKGHPAPPPPQPSTFIADHPFIFMILQNREPLFIGSYVKGDAPITPIHNKPPSNSISPITQLTASANSIPSNMPISGSPSSLAPSVPVVSSPGSPSNAALIMPSGGFPSTV